jgi:hypothetical protein
MVKELAVQLTLRLTTIVQQMNGNSWMMVNVNGNASK